MAPPPPAECAPLDLACKATGSLTSGAVDLVLGGVGDAVARAAQSVSDLALAAIDATTRPDLSAEWVRANAAVLTAVTLPVLVGLFALQVITSVLRQEPGGLGRAVVGVAKATIGSALALAVTQVALVATDGICQAISASAGMTVGESVARVLNVSLLAGPQLGPVLQLLLGATAIIGCLLLWGVLLFRKAAVILVAVFAPIAFAGSIFDHTRVWTRRWIEVITALVLCKIVIVVVFVVGASAFSSSVGVGSSATEVLSDVLVGLLLLSIAVFAPWLTWRLVHWSGVEAGTSMHGALGASPVVMAGRQSLRVARTFVARLP